MKNGIYDNMLSAYDLSTEQQKRNAIFEVNQQVILAGLYNGGFLTLRLSMEAHASAYSMVSKDFPKIWIFLF